EQLFIAFQRMVTGSGYQRHLAAFQRAALDRPTGRFDTHPSLTKRLHALDPGANHDFSPAAKNPLLSTLQPNLVLVARGLCRTATTKIPVAGTHERSGDVPRIDRVDGRTRFWYAVGVIAPLLWIVVGFLIPIGLQAMDSRDPHRLPACATLLD